MTEIRPQTSKVNLLEHKNKIIIIDNVFVLQELLVEGVIEQPPEVEVAHPCAVVVATIWSKSIVSKNATVDFYGAARWNVKSAISMNGLASVNESFVRFFRNTSRNSDQRMRI